MIKSTALIVFLLLASSDSALADQASGSGSGINDEDVVAPGTGSQSVGNKTETFEAGCGYCSNPNCEPLTFSGSMDIVHTCRGSGQYGYVQEIEISTTGSDTFSYTTYNNILKTRYYPLCSTSRNMCSEDNPYTCGYGSGETPVVTITCNNIFFNCNLMYAISWVCESITAATNPPATNPPVTNPPATKPPATKPPATNPSYSYSCCYDGKGLSADNLLCSGVKPPTSYMSINDYTVFYYPNNTVIPTCAKDTSTPEPSTPAPSTPAPSTPKPSTIAPSVTWAAPVATTNTMYSNAEWTQTAVCKVVGLFAMGVALLYQA